MVAVLADGTKFENATKAQRQQQREPPLARRVLRRARGAGSRDECGAAAALPALAVSSSVAAEEHDFVMGEHLLAGAISAGVSRSAVAPLERVKMEMMVGASNASMRRRGFVRSLRTLVKRQGVLDLWAGNATNLLRVMPFRAVNFCAFDFLKRLTMKYGGDCDDDRQGAPWRFVAGAGAGAVATLTCFPLDTIRTRVLAQKGGAGGGPMALARTFRSTIATEGVGALYRGLKPAILAQVPSSAIFYGVYDLLKSRTLYERQRRYEEQQQLAAEGCPHAEAVVKAQTLEDALMLRPLESLLFGGVAGMCSEAVCFPMEVLRRRMQLSGGRLSLTGLVSTIVKDGGLRALYTGFVPSVLQVIPNAALGYFTYERALWLIRHHGGGEGGAPAPA